MARTRSARSGPLAEFGLVPKGKPSGCVFPARRACLPVKCSGRNAGTQTGCLKTHESRSRPTASSQRFVRYKCQLANWHKHFVTCPRLGTVGPKQLRNRIGLMTLVRMRRFHRWPEMRSDTNKSRQLRPAAGTLTPTTGIPLFGKGLLNLWTSLKFAVT